jgi:RNA polymerase sigma-70 factor (ECF subfamily)
MSADDLNRSANLLEAERFATTHWSLVLAAGQRASPESQQALATLCQTYWYPLYAFVRRQGHNAEDARDLTQEFFATLLEKDYLRIADSRRGRFRSFLLAAVKHFLSKQRERANTQKRGGGRQSLPLDFQTGESRYHQEPAHDITPESIYERRWALTLLHQVLQRLQEEFIQAGKQPLFERLKEFLTGDKSRGTYRQVAGELGLTEGAVKVAVHRLRQRYRELLRAEIAQTVTAPEEVDDELRQLFAAVRSQNRKTL